MTVWDELKARGLIAQVTDEEEIKEMVNNGKATFYIGFDPTADSLHVGHFMALCLMKRLQMAGNKPIALLGGGTGMIGDPHTYYGLGLFIEKAPCKARKVYHTGDNGGYLTVEAYFPEKDMFYLVFANRPDWPREKVVTELDSLLAIHKLI